MPKEYQRVVFRTQKDAIAYAHPSKFDGFANLKVTADVNNEMEALNEFGFRVNRNMLTQ